MSEKHERLEVDREDLLGEATALVDRVELIVDDFGEPIVVGFRQERAASIYFGADPAYHFNSAGELRRAYCDGRLYKAAGGRLASLDRRRTGVAVELVRHDLSDDEQRAFLDRLTRELVALRGAVEAGHFVVRGQVSRGGDVLASIRHWLAEVSLRPAVAKRANIR